MTQTATVNNFVAETNGRCFLCSNKINFHPPFSATLESDSSTKSASAYSLHCLARYLGMDMKKVFRGEGPIPPHLLDRVEKSKLVAKLCDECAALTEKFSKLFRHLQKIEMELNCCLNLVYGKLESGMRIDNADINSDDELIAKLEITEALRNDAMQKCSRKLDVALPLTKIRRLTEKQVTAKMLNLRKHAIMTVMNSNDDGSTHRQFSDSNYEDEDDGSPSATPAPNDHGESEYLDEESAVIDDENVERFEMVKQEKRDVFLNPDGSLELEQVSNVCHQSTSNYRAQSTTTKMPKGMDTKKKIGELAIPPPIKVVGEVGEIPEPIKNLENGQFKCPNCSREYRHDRNYQRHYASAYLKVRHKCSACDKDFSFKQHYETHYLNIHMGVKFKCGKCKKIFSQKGQLMQHQKTC